ncbi:hypothetical protein MTP05_27030 (plasmid) [Enterococcus sp. PLM3]|jgi:hypothetical protein|nr:hypothetical protein MTP05_27030 [Enterococcus sp. PLM3]
MKIVNTVFLDKHKDRKTYQEVEKVIFKDLLNKRYVVTLFVELEENEDFQYPLEGILDKYYANCTDHIIENKHNRSMEVGIEDGNDNNFESLETIREIANLVGKRAYNQEEGEYIILKIE